MPQYENALDEEEKETKALKTERIDGEKVEVEAKEEQSILKREMEDQASINNSDKRTRLDNNANMPNRQETTIEMFPKDWNISSLQKKRRQQARNQQYDVKAVARGQMSRLLKMTSVLPDVDAYHDDERLENISSKIAWDDLTGMKLDAGRVIEARVKEMGYITDKAVWTKIPRSTAQDAP